VKAVVFLEHHGDEIDAGALGVLGRVAALGAEDVAAVLAGRGPLSALAAEAGRHGAATVYVAEGDAFEPALPQPCIDVVEHVVRTGGYDTVLLSTSVLATDVAAGLAGRLDAGLNWDLVDILERDGELVGKRLALQDAVLVDVGWRSTPRIALFRRGSFEVSSSSSSSARQPSIETVDVEVQEHSRRARVVGHVPREGGGPSIADADVVVAGGIGLGGADQFALAEELAAELDGAVGATRAAVYKGWYPYAAQVGQTGKTVAPKLYVALGISGAVQHKVGMQNSKVIVAINKDTNAPIFEFSDLGVVGDVHTIVPKLIELLRARPGRAPSGQRGSAG
jgi:electron transfer flavoprotein alpha subunit